MRRHKARTALLLGACAALAAATVPASASAPATPAAGARPAAGHAHRPAVVLVDCVQQPKMRPGTFMLACGDGNNWLASMHWSQWRSSAAAGSGRDVANDCVPYCAAGHFHSYRVAVRLDRVRPWPGHPGQRHFTLMHLYYPGSRPAHTPRNVAFPLWN